MRRLLRCFPLFAALLCMFTGAGPLAAEEGAPRPDRAPAARLPAEIEQHLYLGDMHYFSGELYRANTEYQQFLFKRPADPRADRVRLKMAWVFNIAGEHRDAARLLDELALANPQAPIGWWARYYFAHVAREAGRTDIARAAYDEVLGICASLGSGAAASGADDPAGGDCYRLTLGSQLGVADYFASRHEFDAAAAALRAVADSSAEGAEAHEIAATIEGLRIPRKSPALAGTLSIVPGFGHFYIGEYGIGLTAMAWNGLFIYGLVDSLLAGRWGQAALIGLVESIWYGGTIFGAIAGAHRFNRDAMRIVETGLRQDIARLRADEPWPARFPVDYPAYLELEWAF